MRLILGLDCPSAGTVTVNGKPHRQLASPMHEVGALLDAKAVHGRRGARNHLLCLALVCRALRGRGVPVAADVAPGPFGFRPDTVNRRVQVPGVVTRQS
jgi:hypothetical protein